MRYAAILPLMTALVAAADYAAVDPPPAPAAYAAEKPPALPLPKAKLLLLVKAIEALQGYDAKLPAPLPLDDGVLVEDDYPALDLSKLLAALPKIPPKKYAPKATVKILDKLPGVYGNPASYAASPSPLAAAYKGLGLLPALAPPPVSVVYPPALPAYHLAPQAAPAAVYGIPGYAPSALPAYNVPLSPAPKLPLSPAGLYGVPGYAPPPLDLLKLLKALTKAVLADILKSAPYAAEPVAVEEPAAPAVYAPKPKKPVVVVEKKPSYVPAKVKVVPAVAEPVVKIVKTYVKKVPVPAPAPKPVKVVADPAPASYAADASAPIPALPAYAATEAPAVVYAGVEARSAGEGEPQIPAADAAVSKSAKKADASQSEGGESARASLSDHPISSQKTIS